VAFPRIVPIAPIRVREAFDHRDWIFEPKLDGFRALAYVGDGGCALISRRGYAYKAFAPLAKAIAATLRNRQAVLDGEIVCLNQVGEPQFNALLFRRAALVLRVRPTLDYEDLRLLPLLERKRRLRRLVPRTNSRLLYVDHVARRGHDLFRAVCVTSRASSARSAHSRYVEQPPPWMKVLNPRYTQKIDRHDLFERREDLHKRPAAPSRIR